MTSYHAKRRRARTLIAEGESPASLVLQSSTCGAEASHGCSWILAKGSVHAISNIECWKPANSNFRHHDDDDDGGGRVPWFGVPHQIVFAHADTRKFIRVKTTNIRYDNLIYRPAPPGTHSGPGVKPGLCRGPALWPGAQRLEP